MISWGLGGRKQGFKQMIKTAFQHFPKFNSYALVWLLHNLITYLFIFVFLQHPLCTDNKKIKTGDHMYF